MTEKIASPVIGTCLWFDHQAEEAARFCVSLFEDARIIKVFPSLGGDAVGRAFLVEFELKAQRYTALNGGPHFQLTEAVSIQVKVPGKAEVDHLWEALCEGGTPSQCGWLRDRFGLSWQIIPEILPSSIAKGGAVAERVMAAMMKMGKLGADALEAAARG